MPKGIYVHKRGYHHTKEHIEKIRLGNLGKKRSEKTRIKLSLLHKGKPSPKKDKSNISINCAKCNSLITFPRWKKKKYCNRTCYGTIKKIAPLKYCEICDKEVKMSKSINITYYMRKRFCSPRCRGVYITKDKRGEKSPNWKGENIINRSLRSRFRNTLQKEVLKRDNYRCQICGSGNNLQVDHIKPWAKYKKLRFSMNNCRTLCAKCHYEITLNKPMPVSIIGWGHNLFDQRRTT